VSQDLIGFSYIKVDMSKYYVEAPISDFDAIIGGIWNELTALDSKRYIGGGWYTQSAKAAFTCSLIQIAGLDYESRKSSNDLKTRYNLKPENFSNITC
jgi:hypothetical protein